MGMELECVVFVLHFVVVLVSVVVEVLAGTDCVV